MRVLATVALLLSIASTASAQVDLKIKLEEGAKSKSVTTVKTNQTLTIGGMDVATTADVVSTGTRTVGKREADGTIRLQEKMDSLRVDIGLPGNMSLKFDSSKGDARAGSPELQALVDTFKVISGASYTYVLDKDLKVKAVEGIDKLIAGAPAAAQETLKSELNVERLKKELAEGWDVLPGKPVKKGDRWQRQVTSSIGGGQKLTFENYYEYDGTVQKAGRSLDKINVFSGTVTYSLSPDSTSPLKVLKSDLKVDSSTGHILFDREKGEIVEVSSQMRISGPMTFSIMGMELQGKVDLTMDTGSVVTR